MRNLNPPTRSPKPEGPPQAASALPVAYSESTPTSWTNIVIFTTPRMIEESATPPLPEMSASRPSPSRPHKEDRAGTSQHLGRERSDSWALAPARMSREGLAHRHMLLTIVVCKPASLAPLRTVRNAQFYCEYPIAAPRRFCIPCRSAMITAISPLPVSIPAGCTIGSEDHPFLGIKRGHLQAKLQPAAHK